MDLQHEQSKAPRFICIRGQYLRFELIQAEPKLADLVSEDFTDDTAIVVLDSKDLYLAQAADKKHRGIVYVDRKNFEGVMEKIWTFVDSYQKGSSIRKSVLTLINLLEEGKKQ